MALRQTVTAGDGSYAPHPTGTPGGKSDDSSLRDSDADALRAFEIAFARAKKPYDKRVVDYRKRHDAYNGVMDEAKTAPIRPRGIVLPRYAYQAAEVLISNLVDDRPVGVVTPQAPDDEQSAKAMQQVLAYYRRQDGLDAKLMRHARQTVIMGMSPAKMFWKNYTLHRDKRVWRADPLGGLSESVEPYEMVVDRPSFEPIPVYDFMYDPSASRSDQLGYALSRSWTTLGALKAQGVYRNLDQITEMPNDATGDSKATGRVHPGSPIEVWEFWSQTRLITVANMRTVIQDIPHPFHHCEIPYQIANTTPDLYTCDGISVMDLLIPLQATAWDVLNQLLRNVDLANLLMVKINRTARFDAKQLTNADVGAAFFVDNSSDVEFWNAGGSILEPGMDALSMIKTTMQETTGTGVYLAGGASETIDQKTATGINVLSSMAQKLVLAMRLAMGAEDRRKGLQEMELIQQFIPKPITYRILGAADAGTWSTVMPWELEGNYDYDISDLSESLNKQTARGEAQQLVGMFIQAAPVMQTAGVMPAWDNVMGMLLEAYDRVNPGQYLQAAPPPPPPELPPGGAGPGAGLPTPGDASLGGAPAR